MSLDLLLLRHSLPILATAVAALLVSACDGSSQSLPSLTSLTIDGVVKAMYPGFDPNTHHYGVTCRPSDVLKISANARNVSQSISVDGGPKQGPVVQFDVTNPMEDQDIELVVSQGSVEEIYTIHCLPDDFPDIEVLASSPDVSSDLLYLTPRFNQEGQRKTFLIIVDNNGVPRFRRRIDGNASDFKRHGNGLYSYALGIGQNEFSINDSVIVILDEQFKEIQQLATDGLTQTDNHDFLFTDTGGAIFISYNSTIRDMTEFGLSDNEIVGDSVIQELNAAGSVVFQWNSWDYIDISDCQTTGYPRFPSDYAHLNSINLTNEGDLIASFRGCGQILKIDRPSGDVIWYLGGSNSDFSIVGDPFGEFCGQHTAQELDNGNILLFDNGSFCIGPRESTLGQFSRALEYRLDIAAGQAIFVRDHSLNGTFQEFTRSQGSVQPLVNDNWLIGWGNGPQMSVTEVTAAGEQIFQMRLLIDGSVAVSYRAFRENQL